LKLTPKSGSRTIKEKVMNAITRLALVCLALLVMLPMGLPAQSGPGWELIRHPNNIDKIREQVTEFANQGKTPMGMSIVGDKVYILYITGNRFKLDRWEINWYDSVDELRTGVTAKMNAGFMPVGLHNDGSQFFILYIKTAFKATHWRIVPSERTLESLQQAISDLTADYYVPMDLAAHGDNFYTLLVRIPTTTIKQWHIQTYEADNSAITPGINGMVSQGWSPWGMDFDGDKVRVLFVK